MKCTDQCTAKCDNMAKEHDPILVHEEIDQRIEEDIGGSDIEEDFDEHTV